MKKKLTLAASILGAAVFALPVTAQTHSSQYPQGSQSSASQNQSGTATSTSAGKLDHSDRQFLDKAAQANKAEVELGQLAEQKASSPEVKQFGQRMVQDHTQANQKLEQLASQKGITLPNSLSATDQATKSRLDKLSGKQFDQAYMRDMVKDHTKDVSEFKNQASTAKDSDVKSFAENSVPMLESHLQQAQHIEQGKTTTTSQK